MRKGFLLQHVCSTRGVMEFRRRRENYRLESSGRFYLQDKIGDSMEFVGSYIIKAIANQILLLLYVLIES